MDRWRAASISAALCILLLAGCGGLAGEPGIIATLPPSTPVPTEMGYPLSTPDIAAGAQIFAQHCTQCHGESGRGDGSRIGSGQGQIAQPPADFTNPATTADQTPLEWFTTITDGRIDNFMPPWRDALSAQERWNVALYTYTMHYQSDAVTQGEDVVKQIGVSLDNLPSPPEMVGLTDAALLARYADFAPAVSTLDDAQKQSIIAYLRALTLTNVDMIGKPIVSPATTQEPSASSTPVAGTVSGQITNGTAGGTVPADLKVVLHDFDSQFNDSPHDATADANGQFTFTDIPLAADRSYIVTLTYQGRTFASDFLPGDPVSAKLDLPVKVYEITSDASVIQIAGWVSQITAVEGVLQVAQVVSFTNTSDKAYSNDLLPNDDRYASVQVKLPSGAQVLSIAPDDQRYAIAADSSAVIDTAPVLPGEQHIVQFIYSVPYTGELRIEQSLGYAVQGPVRLLMSPENLTVTSEQFAALGPQTIRDQTYQGYGTSLALTASDVLNYVVQGSAPTTSTAPSSVSSNTLIPLMLVSVGCVIIFIALIIYLRGRKTVSQPVPAQDPQQLIDAVIRQIAELDDDFAAGEIDEETYQHRRDKLKSRLTELMDKE